MQKVTLRINIWKWLLFHISRSCEESYDELSYLEFKIGTDFSFYKIEITFWEVKSVTLDWGTWWISIFLIESDSNF